MEHFRQRIRIVGVNPFVFVPRRVLVEIHRQARKITSPIPVTGTLNGEAFRQTLVKFRAIWRLYLNTPMRKAAGLAVGDMASFDIAFDPATRRERLHPRFARALARNRECKAAFDVLPPSRRRNVCRYLNSLKTAAALDRNCELVMRHLRGENPKILRPLMRGGS